MTRAINTARDVWTAIAQRVAEEAIQWRQDGRPVQRDGRYLARFVAYIEAGTVRERLDSVVPGEWDLTLEPLPMLPGTLDDADDKVAFKARLQVLGVIREDVGCGKDYKQASTDAFKRAAVRFGIGHELYEMEHLWVELDGDGKFAKPVEDPAKAYARKMARTPRAPQQPPAAEPRPGRAREQLRHILQNDLDLPKTSYNYIVDKLGELDDDDEQGHALLLEKTQQVLAQVKAAKAKNTRQQDPMPPAAEPPRPAAPATPAPQQGGPACPKCGGRMWDNRISKRNPAAPDFKCRDRTCDGVIWPDRGARASESAKPGRESDEFEDSRDRPGDWTDEIPF